MSRIGLVIFVSIFGFALGSAQSIDYAYYCPPCGQDCDAIRFESSGDCPHCGMRLLKQSPEEHERSMRIADMTVGFYLQNGVGGS